MCTIKIIKSCTNINACVPMRNKYLNLNYLNLNLKTVGLFGTITVAL